MQNAVTDIDGNTDPIVKIGDKWWMAENLKVTRYRNKETGTAHRKSPNTGATNESGFFRIARWSP